MFPLPFPKGNLEAHPRQLAFKDEDVLFGNIILSPDINKHFLDHVDRSTAPGPCL